jgi:hypothetical protein
MLEPINAAFKRLDSWIEWEKFSGWDPHDALNSPLLRQLTLGNWALSVICVQVIRRSPVNLRPLLGIPKGHNPKAMGLFLESYSQTFLAQRSQKSLDRIQFLIDWLIQNRIQGYSGACWGYNFDWPNRGFFAKKHTPTIVNTAFIGLAFLAAERALETAGLSETTGYDSHGRTRQSALSVARDACEFVLRDLPTVRTSDHEICFSYTPFDRRLVHNANLMGAWLLSSVYVRTFESDLAKNALAAARFTARRQAPDGSWPYGLGKRDQWVDNFHTGFVLCALREIDRNLQTDEFAGAAQKGYRFWKDRMLEDGCIPKYYPQQKYPIDIHSVAQAIVTFLEFSDVDPEAFRAATRLCLWAIDQMQDKDGFFYYQTQRFYRLRIPYMRWGQAWMHLALTKYLQRVRALSKANAGVA